MTPTDAARAALNPKDDSKDYDDVILGIYGPAIARALLDAEERIAALEAENAVMRRCLTDIRDGYDCDNRTEDHDLYCRRCKADGALSYKHAPTITPEGGGK